VQLVDVTPAVWQRLLVVRKGSACTCCGDWSSEERAALDLYGPIARRDVGSVTLGQVGQSLDGRIATVSGDAKELSGPDGLTHLHRIRALVDAVVIGVKTALHDEPRLTVRLCEGENPARVVIDPRGRLPNDSPVLQDNGVRRIVIQAVDTARPPGVELVRLQATDGRFHPEEIVRALNEIGLNNLLIEGGSFTIAKFLEAELLDRLHIAVAPLLIGSGPQGITTNHNFALLNQTIRPKTRNFALGAEVLFDCGLTGRGEAGITPKHP
jgi:riboflavin-specific deaminase-like protein